MRIYEELFIIRPDATEEEVNPIVEQLKNVITQAGGTVDKTENWGVRKLAYRVMKHNEGQYVLLQFTAKPETVHEVERRLRVADDVLKFLTVRIDEKMKRIDKRRKAREKRAARKPVAPPMPAAVVSPLLPHEPAPPIPGAPGSASSPAAPAASVNPPTVNAASPVAPPAAPANGAEKTE